ncbi:CYCB2-3 [Scenedesmus sp. PABB004]|nr:CYCB2-3 [Scenedesmus sp. PABB004]
MAADAGDDGYDAAAAAARTALDAKAKPPGSLGGLEAWAVQLAALQRSAAPRVSPGGSLLLFAADHGAAASHPEISAYPRTVTPAMFHAIAAGQAASSVLAAANGAGVVLVDVGVDADVTAAGAGAGAPGAGAADVLHRKAARGSACVTLGPAMSEGELAAALGAGADAVAAARRAARAAGAADGEWALAVGELGIGNTTAAAALLAALSGASPEDVCGRGTGVDDAGLAAKRRVVAAALAANRELIDSGPLRALRAVGGLELAAMAGAVLEAAERGMPVLVDGFVAGAAALAAVRAAPAAARSLFLSHRSAEAGTAVLVAELGLGAPPLDMGLRLGEGTGALLALPLLRSAAALLRMASLEDVLAAAPPGVSAAAAPARAVQQRGDAAPRSGAAVVALGRRSGVRPGGVALMRPRPSKAPGAAARGAVSARGRTMQPKRKSSLAAARAMAVDENVAARAGKAAPSSKRRALGDIGNVQAPPPGKQQQLDKAAQKPAPAAAAAAAAEPGAQPAAGGAPEAAQQQLGDAPVRITRSKARALAQGAGLTTQPRPRAGGRRSGSLPTPAAPPRREPLPDIDAPDRGNHLAECQYVNDIYAYFRRVEPRFRAPVDYMDRQPDINEKMRAILIDWLVEVHLKFKLMPESLFLTINLIDRYLAVRQVTRKNLQLVGVTAMLVASKYEEIWAPEVRDFVYISDKAYTRAQILSTEKDMLAALGYNLSLPTSYQFLARLLKAAGVHYEKHLALFVAYCAELCLVEHGMLRHSYSELAAGIMYVALRAFKKDDPYPPALAAHAAHGKADVLHVAKEVVRLVAAAHGSSLQAVVKKYSNTKFCEAAMALPPAALTASERASVILTRRAAQRPRPGSGGTSRKQRRPPGRQRRLPGALSRSGAAVSPAIGAASSGTSADVAARGPGTRDGGDPYDAASLRNGELRVFFTGLAFITRLPVPRHVDHHPAMLMRAMAWFPLLGAVVGLWGAAFLRAAAAVLPPAVAAGVSTLSTVWLTGCFHEDGLADSFDGFGGGWGKRQILAIMKDSRVGTYALVGVALVLQLKLAALAALGGAAAPALVAAHCASRWSSAALIYTCDYLEDEEDAKQGLYNPLAQSRRLLTARRVALSAASAALVPLALLGAARGALVVATVLAVSAAAGLYGTSVIGGVVGDYLGATIQLIELAVYLVLLADWPALGDARWRPLLALAGVVALPIAYTRRIVDFDAAGAAKDC